MSIKTNNPFKLKGGITIPHRIFPGPMEGVMSPLFCRTVEEFDLVDFWMTPFLRITTGPIRKVKILKFSERFSSKSKPVIIQLMGTNPAYLLETAHRCRKLGFAGVNFNLACPSKVVLSSGSGGALLKNYEFIKELMEGSLELLKDFSISLKIRIGFESPDEIEEIAKFARKGCPDFIVVHHRTVSEGYDMVTGREKRIAEAVKYFGNIPIIANGDIDSYNDVEKLLSETGSIGVMVARNWLKNPNLIRDIQNRRNITDEQSKEFLAKFINAMAVNSQTKPSKNNRNSIIDMVSYIFDRNHPFFEYLIHTPFKEPDKELSVNSILEKI